ncbi:hypothetical protein CMUST_07680 [Corynebacterium mustelae]|uniref:Uncharacterized protein n=1 Tax=Corynebacterium mustelae TaxID=571915 RepID=A0A0G3H413_9CORY|nr:hypothetical protein [Corynebacterium mustelae]AKK05862.1 hypothetical protein CMUST_07680 [Corynebacterium mustelae]
MTSPKPTPLSVVQGVQSPTEIVEKLNVILDQPVNSLSEEAQQLSAAHDVLQQALQ